MEIMFEKWIYLSPAHRVSKRTGIRQKGKHWVGFPFYQSLNPIDSAKRFSGCNPEVLKVTRWEDTIDTIEVFTEEAKHYNKIISEQQTALKNKHDEEKQIEYTKRIATIQALGRL